MTQRAWAVLSSAALLCVLLSVWSPTQCEGAATHVYNLTVHWQYWNPDGFWRNILFVNSQFPAPLINITQGDTLIVRLANHLPASVITLHWHGLTMKDAPHMDGAAHVTQYPITPLQEFEYKFVVHEYGTYWYHAHLPLQYVDGLLGPLIIQRPNDPLRPLYDEEKVIIIQDWFHAPGNELATPRDMRHHFLPFLLINGKGRTNCTEERRENYCDPNAPLEVISFKPGLRYRLRIISAATRVGISFSMSHHTMKVVEVQGTQVVPYETNELHMTMGGRFDVIVTADQAVDNYWIRTKIIGCDACSPDKTTINLQPNLGWENYGILRYDGAMVMEPIVPFQPPTVASDGHSVLAPVPFHDQRIKTSPSNNTPPPPKATMTFTMNLTSELFMIPTDSVAARRVWKVNSKLFHAEHVPFLLQASQPGAKFSEDHLIYTVPYGSVVDVVYNTQHNQDHPLHLHGFKFYYLGSGPGNYSPETAGPYLNLVDPPLLDTVVAEGLTWTLLRFVADNPGTWLMHCHLDFHHAEEMAVLFVVAPDRLTGHYPPPSFPVCDSYPPYFKNANTPVPPDGHHSEGISDVVLWALIIGAVVVGVVIIGGVLYMYNKSKKNEEEQYLLSSQRH